MSAHSFHKIDQREYLKKYLSGDKVKKKKKDKKHKKSSAADYVKVKIIDDDVNHFDAGPEIDEELLLAGEDAPQIVGEYIEETTASRKVPKWKSIVVKDESDDEEDSDVWGRKSDKVRVKKELPIGKNSSDITPDNSPPRNKNKSRQVSTSPPRRHRKSKSPTRKYSKRDNSPYRFRKNEISTDCRPKIKTEQLSPIYNKRDQSPPQSYNKRKDSLDISPQRNRNCNQSPAKRGKSPSKSNRRRSPDPSPPRRRRNSDQSPPRRRRNSDQSPPRRDNSSTSKENGSKYISTFHNRDPDQNKQRRAEKSNHQSSPRLRRNSYQSPPRRYKSPADHSPPRRKRNFDQSPKRQIRDSISSPHKRNRRSDQSPPRYGRDSRESLQRRRKASSDISPPRKNRSPPYRQILEDPSDRQSSPRRRQNSDLSPPRRSRISPSKHQKRSPDQSPLRRRRNSPPARIKREKQTPELSPRPQYSRWEKKEPEKSLSPPPTHKSKPGRTLEGKKAGLQDAKALQKETTERRKQEDILFERMSSEVSGRNAEVQIRSTGRKGRRAREAAEEDPEERRCKEEHEEKKKLQYDRWGKGLKQIEDHKNRMLEQEYESSKPLARYSNDEDLERHLKEQERAEDPMLEYMRQKRKEKEKESGKPQFPRYEGSYPENRFGIRPGYRWDGVDRSNGYEKRYFAAQNEKRANQDEAYKYSVEDM